MGTWVQVADTFNSGGHDAHQAYCLGVHSGAIYCGTKAQDSSDPMGGYVLQWNGVDSWMLRGTPYDPTADAITSLLSDSGVLYATSGAWYHSPLTYGGCLLMLSVPDLNLRCIKRYNQHQIWSLTNFGGKLYTGTFPRMFLFSKPTTVSGNWVDEVITGYPPPAQAMTALCVYNGKLYGATVVDGLLFEFDDPGDAWVQKAPHYGVVPGIYKLLVYDDGGGDKLYGISTRGELLQWNDVDAWVQKAPSAAFLWRGCVHNGYIYAGERQSGSRLYRWNKVDAWELVADSFPGETDVYDLLSHGGKLYGATGQNGKLLEFDDDTTLFITPPSIPSLEDLGNPEITKTSTPLPAIPPPVSLDGDIRLEHNVNNQYFEIIPADRDVDRDGGFETAVLITLSTDKRADEGDPLPDEGGYKGGWWADDIPVVPDYRIGTKLWLLQRSKTKTNIPALAEEYLRDGFQWMLDDGIVENVEVLVERTRLGNQPVLNIVLGFQKPAGETIFYRFYYNWEAQILRRQ